MGVGIAQVFVDAGMDVAVFEPSHPARQSFDERVQHGRELTGLPARADAGQLSLHAVLGDAVADATLVIEAGPERLAVKQDTFVALEPLVGEETVMASNTSSIPIEQIGAGMKSTVQLVGMHFWNPPALVRLVEVVRAASSSTEAVDRAFGLLERIAMLPVRVEADVPGFVGNRMQHALKREAIALVAAGVCSAETVDLVVREGFGARLGIVGPLEQSDLSGTSLTLAIHEVLMPHLDVTPVPHPYLVDMVRRGDLGASSGRGFREWAPGEADRRREQIAEALRREGRRRATERGDGPA